MNRIHLNRFALALAGLSLFACKDEEPLPVTNLQWVTPISDTSSLHILTREMGLMPATTSVALSAKTVVDLDGTRLVLEGLRDSATGVDVADGTGEFSLLQLDTPGELIRYQAITETLEGPMQMEGGMYYRIVRDGRPLLARTLAASLKRTSVGQPLPSIHYHYDLPDEEYNVWVPIVPSDATPRVTEGFNTQPGEEEPAEAYFTFRSFNNPFRTLACLYEANLTGSAVPEVNLPEWASPHNTLVYFLTADGRSVLRTEPFFQHTSFKTGYPLTEGAAYRIVTMSWVQGQRYYGLWSGALPKEGSIEIVPDAVSLAELKARLEAL